MGVTNQVGYALNWTAKDHRSMNRDAVNVYSIISTVDWVTVIMSIAFHYTTRHVSTTNYVHVK